MTCRPCSPTAVALYMALIASIRAHPSRQRAVRAALNAVEAARVERLNRPDTPEPWLHALQSMHEALARCLAAEFPER